MPGKYKNRLFDKVYGSLIGGLIGDAMGAPSEGMTWREIEDKFGKITDFAGAGTDDSAIKQILCEALIEHGGHITADEFADSFLKNKSKYYNLFFIPVRNMLHKLEAGLTIPIDAGYGNMHSSSSAMSISPMGIVNACNPRQAAIEAFEVAGLIHSGPAAFCRDGAAAVAAAVAEAMREDASVQSVIDVSTAYLHKTSGAKMADEIQKIVKNAKDIGSYEAFRDWFYANCLSDIICNSIETVPCVMALFLLADGDPETAIIYAANFGRDTDTIATMVGAIAGALKGASDIRADWVRKVEDAAGTKQKTSKFYNGTTVELTNQIVLAEQLYDLVIKRIKEADLFINELNMMSNN
jgi:ADP-ribosylglycohydrolase